MPSAWRDRARFWSKVDVRNVNECWLWQAGLFNNGYGQFMHHGYPKGAHRVAMEFAGQRPPKGSEVCHKCDVRRCVNPRHLYIGNHQQNMDDAKRRNRMARQKGELHGSAKLTADDVLTIRMLSKAGMAYASLGDLYEVTPGTIGKIVTRKRWGHI